MDRQTSNELHELHARICKAIADPKRLLIITELRTGPMTVGELALSLDISQSNTSQHLEGGDEAGVWRAWGTLPSSIPSDYRGEVGIRATFNPKPNAAHEAWFSRPTGKVLS